MEELFITRQKALIEFPELGDVHINPIKLVSVSQIAPDRRMQYYASFKKYIPKHLLHDPAWAEYYYALSSGVSGPAMYNYNYKYSYGGGLTHSVNKLIFADTQILKGTTIQNALTTLAEKISGSY